MTTSPTTDHHRPADLQAAVNAADIVALPASRRAFLRRSLATAAGFAGLHLVMGRGTFASTLQTSAQTSAAGYGPLVPDPRRIFDLPEGFTYRIISRVGERMDDGLVVPGAHDGMAAFPGPDGLTLIVRNHELSRGSDLSPFVNGGGSARMRERIWDLGFGSPVPGGTTTLVYDTSSQRLVRHFMSLCGTERNCAGGPTPRNSWITCEETMSVRAEGTYEQTHGYCFEVPARAELEDGFGLVKPEPIIPMGRFNHEACATSPATGIVYQTEDRHDGLIYRYIPKNPDDLLAGGRLQALKIVGAPKLDTRNWGSLAGTVKVGDRLACEWIDFDDLDADLTAPDDDLRFKGFEAGAARFARGEGMWYAEVTKGNRRVPTVFFACTNGGVAKAGQIFKLELPGDDTEKNTRAGTLELFVEPNDRGVLENADNITIAPTGDMFVCEDGDGGQFLLGISPAGDIYKFGHNAMSESELAGAAFSPDGTTMFVNIQHEGITLAITGPWRKA